MTKEGLIELATATGKVGFNGASLSRVTKGDDQRRSVRGASLSPVRKDSLVPAARARLHRFNGASLSRVTKVPTRRTAAQCV